MSARLTRTVPAVITVVDFYRKLLDIERRRRRWGAPLMVLAGVQLFASFLAMTSLVPSFRARVLLAVASLVVFGVIAVFALRHLARRGREIRDLSDDT
jgi:heme A synthase